MARTPIQPSTATQRNTASATPDIDARGPLDEQDQRSDNNEYSDNTEYSGNNERRESGLTSVRDEPAHHAQRATTADDRRNRDERTFGEKRGFGQSGDSRGQFGERGEQDSRRAPWATSGAEAYAPVLDAWKQVFQSWSELAETMVKVQQQSFAAMMGATQATAKNLTNGDRGDREPALSGARSDSPASDQIDHDRR